MNLLVLLTGKTLFLRYTIGWALTEGMPIILCENSQYFLYFDESGVRRIVYATLNYFEIDLPPWIIALFDSTVDMCSPYEYFLDSSCPVFVVQATSPERPRWYEWAKQLEAWIWLMMLRRGNSSVVRGLHSLASVILMYSQEHPATN